MNKRKKFISVMAGILAAVMVLSLILGLIPVANAKSSDEIRGQINDLKAQRSMIREEMQNLKDQYEKNEDEIADLVARKVLIDQEIFLLCAEIEIISDEISAFALLIADKQDELDNAQTRSLCSSFSSQNRVWALSSSSCLSAISSAKALISSLMISISAQSRKIS